MPCGILDSRATKDDAIFASQTDGSGVVAQWRAIAARNIDRQIAVDRDLTLRLQPRRFLRCRRRQLRAVIRRTFECATNSPLHTVAVPTLVAPLAHTAAPPGNAAAPMLRQTLARHSDLSLGPFGRRR